MAASRPLGATAACVILLSFSAGHRKLYWNGYIQVAVVICQQIFSILAPVFFLLKVFLKPFQNCAFFGFGVKIHPAWELQFLAPLYVVLLFCVRASVCKSFSV